MRRREQLFGFERNVFLLGLASLLNDASSEIIYPLLPVFVTAVLGGGPAYLGLIEGVAESTASLLKLVSGWVSDRLGRRKPLVVAGYGLAALGRPLLALATLPWQVLALRFVDRTGKGLRTAPRDALLAASAAETTWGRSFGFHRAMDHLGAVIGPLAAVALMAWFANDYRAVFAVAALPGLLAVVTVAAAVREVAPPKTHLTGPVPLRLPASPVLRGFVAAVFVFSLGNSTDAFLLLRAQDVGVTPAHLPLLWVLLHIVKTATSVPGGALSDRIGRRRVILAGWALYAAVYLGFAHAGGPAAAWALFAIYGVFFGLTEGTEKALIADLVPAAQRGAAFGVYHLSIGLAALPASVLFGLLWAWGGAALAFTVGAVLAALAAALLLLLVPDERRPARG